MLAASPPASTGPAPQTDLAPPAEGYPYLAVAMAGSSTPVKPGTLLQLDRGTPKLANLADWAQPSMQASLRPIVGSAVKDPATPADLPRLAAEKAVMAVHFPGSRIYFVNVGGYRLFASMRAYSNQAWTLLEMQGHPDVYALVSNAKPEFAFGIKDGKLAMVPVTEPESLIGVKLAYHASPVPKVDIKAAPAAAPRVPAQPAQARPAAAAPARPAVVAPPVPAAPGHQQQQQQQQQQAAAAAATAAAAKKLAPMVPIAAENVAAAIKSGELSSALDELREKGNHGVEITVPFAVQYKDREQYILAESVADPSGTNLMVGKVDPLREGAKLAFFEFFALVEDPDDAENPEGHKKTSLKPYDSKQARDQQVVIHLPRTKQLLAAHANGRFFATEDINSQEVLWRIIKDPSSQLAVSLIHVKSNKRLVIEKSKSGRLARSAPLAARLTGDASRPADENSIFTLCLERQACVDLQHQARGLQTFKERLRENASIISPFAMAASAIAGLSATAVNLMSNNGGGFARGGGDNDTGVGATGAGMLAPGYGETTSRQQRDEGNSATQDTTQDSAAYYGPASGNGNGYEDVGMSWDDYRPSGWAHQQIDENRHGVSSEALTMDTTASAEPMWHFEESAGIAMPAGAFIEPVESTVDDGGDFMVDMADFEADDGNDGE
ncbi:hypothetical protein H9P43_002705 [Blastocladiella emersonii ATCC 22665]|nr:hypothetical protein H9P43_002670 [Blastocladiella emersonii ATCC 22665]KAI9188314.1 hypothetical protein H9P43_002705 [Blastocladiella emersonii ATCC 22665]